MRVTNKQTPLFNTHLFTHHPSDWKLKTSLDKSGFDDTNANVDSISIQLAGHILAQESPFLTEVLYFPSRHIPRE